MATELYPRTSLWTSLTSALHPRVCGRSFIHLSQLIGKMLTSRIARGVPRILKRNFGIVAPALQKASDPIQQLFLDKVREYKSKSVGGKLVDATPEVEKELKSELEKLAAHYGGRSGVDMTAFPQFKFDEPKVDPQLSEK